MTEVKPWLPLPRRWWPSCPVGIEDHLHRYILGGHLHSFGRVLPAKDLALDTEVSLVEAVEEGHASLLGEM